MEDYQLRVIKEKRNLDKKIKKLKGFLANSLNILPNDYDIMIRQKKAMLEYSVVLGIRIQRWESNK